MNTLNFYMLPEVSSTYIRVIALLSSFAPIVHFCSPMLIVKNGIENDESSRVAHLRLAFVSIAIQSIVMVFVATHSIHLGDLFATDRRYPFAFLWLLMVCYGCYDLGKTLFLGRGEYSRAFAVQCLFAVATALSCALSVGVDRDGLLVAAAALCLPGAVVAGLIVRRDRERSTAGRPMRLRHLLDFGRFGFPLVISALSINPALQLFIDTTGGLGASERVALTLALNWNGIILSLPGMISTTSLDLFLRHETDRRGTDLLRLSYGAICMVGTAIVTGLCWAAPSLFEFGGRAMGGIVIVVVLSSVPMALSLVESNVFLSTDRTDHVLHGNVAFFVVLAAAWAISMRCPISPAVAAATIVVAHCARYAVMRLLSARLSRRASRLVR
jgi:hypothetical protein